MTEQLAKLKQIRERFRTKQIEKEEPLELGVNIPQNVIGGASE